MSGCKVVMHGIAYVHIFGIFLNKYRGFTTFPADLPHGRAALHPVEIDTSIAGWE